jgi:hypothetical protein
MHDRKFSRSVLGVILGTALCTLLTGTASVSAADRPGVIKKIRKGRLPNHYGDVVTEKQRDDIYKIQEEYKPKIDVLKGQLAALTKEMNDKISAVLTTEQKQKIDDAAAAAKANRAKRDTPTEAVKPKEKTEKKAEK